MMRQDFRLNIKRALLCIMHYALCIALLASCARMGSPDGGWYDDDPPVVLGSTPAAKATGVKAKKVTIYFDEYIKLADPTQNVIVSPPQIEMPEIAAKGKKIVIELKDSLKPDMTYTIDFSDAISDNNEDNPMGNYTFTFSTGTQTYDSTIHGNNTYIQTIVGKCQHRHSATLYTCTYLGDAHTRRHIRREIGNTCRIHLLLGLLTGIFCQLAVSAPTGTAIVDSYNILSSTTVSHYNSPLRN